MKLLNWTLPFLLLVASAAFAQQVQTSKSTLTLPNVGEASTENSLRQAKAIVEIALGELGADVAGLVKDEAALAKEAAAYEAANKAEKAVFANIKKKYDTRLAKYEAVVAPLTAEILAFNALPRNQQDMGTLAQLTKRKAVSDAEYKSLNAEKAAGDKSMAEGAAKLKDIRDSLATRINLLNATLGLAYRQLKLCAAYAEKIDTMLLTKFKKTEIRSRALNGAMEQLKALGSRGFDIP